MASLPIEYNINGNIWRDVTNETIADANARVYPLDDVIKCGGKEPWFVSGGGTPDEPKD